MLMFHGYPGREGGHRQTCNAPRLLTVLVILAAAATRRPGGRLNVPDAAVAAKRQFQAQLKERAKLGYRRPQVRQVAGPATTGFGELPVSVKGERLDLRARLTPGAAANRCCI